MTNLKSYVCGDWHTGTAGDPSPLYNPSTEAVIAEFRSGGIDFGAVLEHATAVGGPALRELGFSRRAALLKALSAAIHEHRDELIEIAARNGGNTRGDAKFDIDGASGTLAAYASFGKRLGDGNSLPDGDGVQLGRSSRFWGQHILTPRPGVALHINAFNFPSWGMAEKMACALLAGVPVIEKPGTPSALLAHRIAEIVVDRAILPAGSFQFVLGRTGDLLERLGPMDSVAFTGSAATGAALKGGDSIIRRNVRMNIEADSINAAVLGPDAGPDDEAFQLMVANLAVDITQKAGQKCTAVRRIAVPAERREELVEALVDRLKSIVVGDPSDGDVRMGPVASASALRDVRAGMERLLEVSRAATGGPEPIAERGYFVAPTLLVADDAGPEVLHELEVFGPCATVMSYPGAADEAVTLLNRGGGGLVASVYSNDRAFTETVVRGIAPWHGRIWIGSDKVSGHALGPGAVLPQSVHGGPGRAGGGEELGGLRGLSFYMQRTALQGHQGLIARSFGPAAPED